MADKRDESLIDMQLFFDHLPALTEDSGLILNEKEMSEIDEIEQIRQMVLEITDEQPLFMTTT